METHRYQKLFLTAFYFLIFFNYAYSSPGLEPVSSPGPQPGYPPASESTLDLNSLSFPPSGSDPPSGSISGYSKNFLSDTDPPSGSITPDLENSPSGEGFDSLDSALIADSPSGAFPPINSDLPSESISPSSDLGPGIRKICASTDFPSLCLATVVPFLKGRTDVHSVLEVTIKASKELARIAYTVVKRLANSPGVPPKLAAILNDCKDSYDDALVNFESAMNAFVNRDIGTMNTMLSAVITDIGDCEDEISEAGSSFPVSSYADKLTNMTSNCLAIVSLIH